MKNREAAEVLYEIADLLELKGENIYRIIAYREAARTIEHYPEAIEKLDEEGRLEEIPRVGEALAKKLHEYLSTGELSYLEKLKKEFPPGLMELREVPGVGPRTAMLLYKKLGIESIKELEKAAKEHKLRVLPRMGEKAEEKILRGIEMLRAKTGRLLLGVALPAAEEVVELLCKAKGVEKVSPAGSIRRMKETIGDIDILVASNAPELVMRAFAALPIVKEVLQVGETKATILSKDNLQIDLRVVAPESWGAALQYFTGSKAHNIKLRDMALKRGWKVNEYGVFKGEKRIGGESEEGLYEMLGLQFIQPEMREDQGEVELSLKEKLPDLVELKEIKGDIHAHTKWSDGNASIIEMAKAAKQRGYEYLAICDHSKSLGVAGGLSEGEFAKQQKEIAKTMDALDFHILAGVEVNILSDGSLDLGDDALAERDIVVAGIHTGFNQSREKITGRIISAMENENVDIISHPTGRLIERRSPYEVDIERIINVASETGTVLEINAAPERLDLKDIDARRAKEHGVRVAISTDAHSTGTLDYMRYGVATARRGWLEAKDVINTLSYKQLAKVLS